MSLYIFVLLIAVVAFLLILVIMVQNPKGGGLDSNFGGGGGNMLGGVKQTTDFLDKATWTLFSLLIVLILISNSVIIKSTAPTSSKIKDAIEKNAPLQDDSKTAPNPLLPSGTEQPKGDSK